VRLDAIRVTGRGGEPRDVEPESVHHNGVRLTDGAVSFLTGDPAFWWPADGDEGQVTIRGRWQFDDALQTILKQSQLIHELTGQIGEARREVERVHASPSWRLTKPLRLAKAMARRLKAG
jgi:hypothetical protein